MQAALTLDDDSLDGLDAEQLKRLVRTLVDNRSRDAQAIAWRDLKIDKLTFELAQLRRLKFGRSSEQLAADQRALFEEAVTEDIAAAEDTLAELRAASAATSPSPAPSVPKRAALPAHLPRREVRHDPESTVCGCGCAMRRIGEDISEKLDYTPGVFHVERHVRGKWACMACRTLVQAPLPACVIDKGMPTAGLLAQVLIAKHGDHLPLYRQEAIFGRAGFAIPRSTLAQWVGVCGTRLEPVAQALKDELLACQVLHADETPVAVLAPGAGKTHRAYLWAYAAATSEPIRAVVYDFTETRSGKHARAFLGHEPQADGRAQRAAWTGQLVCDDFGGYKALFERGVTEVGCMAHARRKFIELHEANKSTLAATAIELIGQLYGIERDIEGLSGDARLHQRQARAGPIAQALFDWLVAQRTRVPAGSATARAIDYSLARWAALTRYLEDARLPIDNNLDERQIRPWTTGRKNWLFAGSLAAGQRAAAVMSLIQSAKLNGLEPYGYLKDVLERLPTQRASRIGELLPHRWTSIATTAPT